MNSVEKANEKTEQLERLERRQKLFQLIELILQGKIDGSKTPLARIFNQNGPREQYVSPKDRGEYNYGYMGLFDLVETPFLR